MGLALRAGDDRPMAGEQRAGVTLSVVIPALNEQDGIGGIIEKVQAVEAELKRVGVTELEVIVVDDGSDDATAERVCAIQGVRLVRHAVNLGYGAALKTGFSHATGELLAFLDADNTYPPESFARLCEIAIDGKADVVIGSRRSGGQSSMPAVRRLGNLIWSSLLSVIGGERVQDPASGMRVFWRRCLRRLYPLPDGLHFTPVMSTRALHEGLNVVEVAIPYRERAGRSKLSVVRDGIRFLATILWTALQYNPARILELAGFGMLLVAGVLGGGLVAARLSGVTELGAWGVLAVYGSLVAAVGGVGAFSLGMAFNRLVSLFYKYPVRQPNLLAAVLGRSPERHFPWMGALLAGAGFAVAALSLILGLSGWDMARLWLWLLGSALFVLVGVQLSLFWMLIRVLDTVIEREDRVEAELSPREAPVQLITGDLRTAANGPRV